jgi:hypothetical protein
MVEKPIPAIRGGSSIPVAWALAQASVLDSLVKIASCLDIFFELDFSFAVCPGFTKILGPPLLVEELRPLPLPLTSIRTMT